MGLLDNWQGLAWTHPSLWVARPLRPDSGDIAVLATHNDFPAALDTYAQIQRGIKLAAAWCRMAHALTQRPLGPPYNVNQVELVDESMMGAWINGSTEAEGRWLLEMRVPCFLIHEVESEVELSNAVNLSTRSSFTVGTAVMDLVLTKNPLDVVVLWNGGNLVDVAEDMWIASSVPPSLWHDRMRSSSYGQGWRRKLDKYVAPPTLPDLGFVERDGLIIPPAVMSAGTGPGHWTHWEEDQTEDGDFCFKRLGKEKGKANSGKMWDPKCTDVGREHLPPLALHLDPDHMDETNDGFVPEPLPIRRPPSPIHRTASPFHRPESPKRRSPSPPRRKSVRAPSRDPDPRPAFHRRLQSPPRRRSPEPRFGYRSPPRLLPVPALHREDSLRSPASARCYSPSPSPRPTSRQTLSPRGSLSRQRSRSRSWSPRGRSRSRGHSRSLSRSVSRSEGSSAYQDEYDETLIRRCAPKPEDAARLEVLFPRPPPPSFPILSEIGARKQSSILAISNLPVFYHWVDVLAWLRSTLNLVNRPHVERVLRSQEDGFQVFWVKLRNPTEAATLRGLLHDRRVAGCPLLRVDFVSGDVYSARCTAHRDAWSPVFGMEIENRPRTTGTIYDRVGLVDPADRPADAPAVSDPFPAKDFLDRFDDPPPVLADPPEASSSSLPLADRLTPPCRTRKRNRKPKRSRQGLDPADGGAL
ncbi:hypothetical protein BJ912DRAFT_936906 [Pholiota molesta]|nr:hypothetical protein BJ912DRAFT_936906 [Pholiota molesta]